MRQKYLKALYSSPTARGNTKNVAMKRVNAVPCGSAILF